MQTTPVTMSDPSKNIPTYFVLFIYIITFLIGVPANILAFYTFLCKVRRKPAPIDILLLNLTISDLVFLAFLPFKMKEAVDNQMWNLPLVLCPVTGFMFFATIYTSTLFLTAVSVERYMSVAHPIRYQKQGRSVYVVWASVIFWVISLSHCSIVFVMHYNVTNLITAQNRCYENFSREQLRVLLPVRLEMFLVLFLIPSLICSFCYISFIRVLSRRPKINRQQRLRAIGLALGTLLVFVLCFGPFSASHIYGFIWGVSADWRMMVIPLSTINACLDPIIFYLSSSDVRSMLSHYLESCRTRLSRHGP